MEIRKIFASRLKKARELVGLSQRDLGILIGLSDKSISAYEKGRVIPPLDILPKLSKELNKPISYFINEENIVDRLVLRIEKLEEIMKDLTEIIAEMKKNPPLT